MDFIGGLPKARGADTIMVIVDSLSMLISFLCFILYLAKEVTVVFVKESVGCMVSLISLFLIGIDFQ